MEIFFYLFFGALCLAFAMLLKVAITVKQKLASKTAEAEALRSEVDSTNLKMDRIGEIFTYIEESADRTIHELATKNAELERLLETNGHMRN